MRQSIPTRVDEEPTCRGGHKIAHIRRVSPLAALGYHLESRLEE